VGVCGGRKFGAGIRGFEDTLGCPYNYDQVYKCYGWSSYGESSDYFNSCGQDGFIGVPNNSTGYQTAAAGNAYCGLSTEGFNHYREFIGAQLNSSLITALNIMSA